MRILNETEMSVAAGGVDPMPIPAPEPIVKPDKEDVFWITYLLSLQRDGDNS